MPEKEIANRLVVMGYEKNYQVEAPGQFSIRGGIVDIFDLTEENPYRIELWGDEIESIRSFDILSQRSIENLQEIRRKHGEVLYVGDGINDAPVLAGADVGAAMGSGADAAIEAADVVFMTSSLEAVPEAISIARRTGKIAIQNVVFALGVKFFVMILGFLGMANMWMAVFADTGVAMLCVLNSIRVLSSSSF